MNYKSDSEWRELGVEPKHAGKQLDSLFCRAVGCKGTSVELVPTKEGLLSLFSDVTGEGTGGTLTWGELENMLEYAKKKKLYIPK